MTVETVTIYDAIETVQVFDPAEVVQVDQPGLPGPQGLSAYQVAVGGGFTGSEEEWLASLQGPSGPGDAGYFFVQASPLSVWDISHNLSRYPSVVVLDSAGGLMEGEVVYLDQNTVRLTFSSPFSGTAQLN